jgi:hypothetical protein
MKTYAFALGRIAANLVVVAAMVASLHALADEADVPAFAGRPIFFVERSGTSVTGQLLLGDIDSKSAKFHLWAGGFGGGHLCTVSGLATSTDGKSYEFREPNCNLNIRIEGDTAYVVDLGKHCSREAHHCGYRAGINPMQLHTAPLSQSMYWRAVTKAKQ